MTFSGALALSCNTAAGAESAVVAAFAAEKQGRAGRRAAAGCVPLSIELCQRQHAQGMPVEGGAEAVNALIAQSGWELEHVRVKDLLVPGLRRPGQWL